MCRGTAEGGRRCYHGTEYERVLRNLKAKKQYHRRAGNTSQVEAVEKKVSAYEAEANHLRQLGDATLHPIKIELTENTHKLLKALKDAGYKAYIVGGTVRDALTGEPVKDVDIEVYGAEPDSLTATLKAFTKHVDEVGQQFGVLKVQLSSEEFDVSLPRKENRTGASHTSFEVETDKDMTIAEASARRDFTVNALLYDPELEHVVDPQSGMDDWESRTLKHVSDAFDEDPLRVLRGAQMAARFNMELHPETVKKAETLAGEFPNLAKERVQIEFQKLFTKSFHPEKGFKVLKDTTWDTNFPGLAAANTETLHAQLTGAGQTALKQELNDDTRAAFFGAVIASHIKPDVRRDFLSYITVGDRIKNTAHALASTNLPEALDDRTLRHWVKNAPNSITLESWLRVQKTIRTDQTAQLQSIENRAKELNILTAPEEDLIKGDTLMDILSTPKNGKWVGDALRKIRDAQYSNKFRTLETAVEWVKQNRSDLSPTTS